MKAFQAVIKGERNPPATQAIMKSRSLLLEEELWEHSTIGMDRKEVE
jgi:hypothetical protein